MSTRHPSVLVVDDEIDICNNLSDILTAFGYDVETATNGFAALDLVQRRPFDVALLDLKMPGMDGLTLYRKLKKLRAGTVAMLVTAYAGGDTTREAIDAGAWQVLPKPVDVGRLLGEVERVVGQPTLLVVDDDADLCENLWQILRQKDFRVCLAHSHDEATRKLQENPYRIILLDLKLPGGNGVGLMETIRESNPEAKIVVITGHRSELEETIDRVLSEGAEGVCYKPFDVNRLLEMIQHAAEQNRT
ncbi:MAG: response regulator [Planctomycetaceae bacterium]|nr:response regulator [Planctomycetaceae bacterium]